MKQRSKMAFRLNVEELGERLYFWTFTFRRVMDLKDARRHWGNLLKLLRTHVGALQGLRVFEMHEGHGLHVHCVTTRYLRVEKVRECIYRMKGVPFGRLHVVKAKSSVGPYLAKYLAKERPKALKGWRLWAALDTSSYRHTRVADMIYDCLMSRTWKAASRAFGWVGNKGFRDKRITVNKLVQLCIVYNCSPGEWPGGIWDLKDVGFLEWYRNGIRDAMGPF